MNVSRSNLLTSTNGGRSYTIASNKPEPIGGEYRDGIVFCRRCDSARSGAGAVRVGEDVLCASCVGGVQ